MDNGVELFVKYADNKSIANYFEYAISVNSYDDVNYLWNYMGTNNILISEDLKLEYVNYLMTQNDYRSAFSIWNQIYPGGGRRDNKNRVWNGSFESEIMNKGFDWNISPAKGVAVDLDDQTSFSGGNSIKITFDGQYNINYDHISQVIPIEKSGEYSFEFAYKSTGVTTRHGLYIELSCNDASGTYLKTNMIIGNNDWHKDKLYFRVEDDCTLIKITIRRDRINKLDSKIKGTVWLDDFNISKAG